MRQYLYRVTLEQLTDSHGVPSERKPLQFNRPLKNPPPTPALAATI